MVFKNSFTLLVASRTTPFFVVVPIFLSTIVENIHERFKANKLPLNNKKTTKYSFFHPISKANNLPLRLRTLEINNNNIIERQPKFIGVLLDENLSWKPHINTIQSKIAKTLGLLYKARNLMKSHCLKELYFSNIHSYLTYAHIICGSTNKSKLMGHYRQQKHASRIIYYSTLSITRILENSNVSKTRTNSPVPWPSHSSLGKKALENSNLDNSNFSISRTLLSVPWTIFSR